MVPKALDKEVITLSPQNLKRVTVKNIPGNGYENHASLADLCHLESYIKTLSVSKFNASLRDNFEASYDITEISNTLQARLILELKGPVE